MIWTHLPIYSNPRQTYLYVDPRLFEQTYLSSDPRWHVLVQRVVKQSATYVRVLLIFGCEIKVIQSVCTGDGWPIFYNTVTSYCCVVGLHIGQQQTSWLNDVMASSSSHSSGSNGLGDVTWAAWISSYHSCNNVFDVTLVNSSRLASSYAVVPAWGEFIKV